jgi:hypothetical protein
MSSDWKPSNHRPAGVWRGLVPGRRTLRAALAGAGSLAVLTVAFNGWSSDLSFNLMNIGAAILAAACVAPHLFSAKPAPRPGRFPTGRVDDGAVAQSDDDMTR